MPQPPNKQLAVFGKRFNSAQIISLSLSLFLSSSRLTRCRSESESRRFILARRRKRREGRSGIGVRVPPRADKVEGRAVAVMDDGRTRRSHRTGRRPGRAHVVVTSKPAERSGVSTNGVLSERASDDAEHYWAHSFVSS